MLSKSQSTYNRKLVVLGLITAICIILTYTPLGMIPLPMVSVTIAHVPVIIVAILEGPVMGGIAGCILGLATLVKALTMPSGVLDYFFVNPVVSVLPRILIGFTTYFIYKSVRNINENTGIVIGSALGSITNTIGCIGLLYLIYGGHGLSDNSGTAGVFILSILSILTTIGLAEAVVASIAAFAVIKALKRAFNI